MPRRRDLLLMSAFGVLVNIFVAWFTVDNGMWMMLPVNITAASICAFSFERVRRRYRDE